MYPIGYHMFPRCRFAISLLLDHIRILDPQVRQTEKQQPNNSPTNHLRANYYKSKKPELKGFLRGIPLLFTTREENGDSYLIPLNGFLGT